MEFLSEIGLNETATKRFNSLYSESRVMILLLCCNVDGALSLVLENTFNFFKVME